MLRIFYSWISDPERERNRGFVSDAIREALGRSAVRFGASSELSQVVQCERFPEPTDIPRFIVETIPTCHALVGDVSFINVAGAGLRRWTPNPNTMFEVGLATHCLGPGKVILVFNTDSGSPSDLPFDVRNHVVLTWSGNDSPAHLADRLQDSIDTVSRNYLALANGLTRDFARCLEALDRFFETFLLRHVEGRRPGFAAGFMALFRQGPDEAICFPSAGAVAHILREYQRPFLAAPSDVEGFTEGNLFALILRRLHHDSERLTYRYRDLRGGELYRQVERIGVEAGHLERLLERVVNRVPDLMVNEIIGDEILVFLRAAIEIRREIARCARMAPS